MKLSRWRSTSLYLHKRQFSHFQLLHYGSWFCYSVLKLFTGFAIAAFIAWKLTTNIVINNEPIPAAAKIHHEIPCGNYNSAASYA